MSGQNIKSQVPFYPLCMFQLSLLLGPKGCISHPCYPISHVVTKAKNCDQITTIWKYDHSALDQCHFFHFFLLTILFLYN